jgi:hypothetical protein
MFSLHFLQRTSLRKNCKLKPRLCNCSYQSIFNFYLAKQEVGEKGRKEGASLVFAAAGVGWEGRGLATTIFMEWWSCFHLVGFPAKLAHTFAEPNKDIVKIKNVAVDMLICCGLNTHLAQLAGTTFG